MAQMIFSKRSKATYLTKINPFAKLIALIGLSFLLNSGNEYLFFSAVIFITLLSILVRIPFFKYLRRSKALLYLVAFIAVTEALVSKSLYSTIYESLKFIYLILLSALLLDSTSPGEIASSLGGVLSHIAGKHAWVFSSYIMLSVSFIARIFTISSEMMDARRSRLGSFFHHPIKNITEYTSSLFSSLFEDLRMYSLALSSRLYDEKSERIRKDYKAADYAIILISIIMIVWSSLS